MSTLTSNASAQRMRRRRQRGFTLRELMLAVSLGGVVMATVVGLVHNAMDWSTSMRHHRLDDQAFFQLSRQIRNDLHATDQAELNSQVGEVQTLKLSMPGGNVVVYQTHDRGLSRTESRDEQTVRSEAYRFYQPYSIRLMRLDTENQIQLDFKRVTPFAETEVPLWRSLRITPGLRLRHQGGQVVIESSIPVVYEYDPRNFGRVGRLSGREGFFHVVDVKDLKGAAGLAIHDSTSSRFARPSGQQRELRRRYALQGGEILS